MFETPIFLIKKDIPTYISPETKIPPCAYLKSPYCAATAPITGINAKDDPKNTGTFPFVQKWKSKVPTPAENRLV